MLPAPDESEIDPESLHALFASGERDSIRLIDCREEDEFLICRLPGADLIPLSRFAGEASRELVGEERPLVIYCHHGMRSMNATLYLREKGHPRCWSLAGGIDLWSRKIDPSVPRY